MRQQGPFITCSCVLQWAQTMHHVIAHEHASFSALVDEIDPKHEKSRIATEWGVMTGTVGGKTYSHTVNTKCYNGSTATVRSDDVVMTSAYAVRVLAVCETNLA